MNFIKLMIFDYGFYYIDINYNRMKKVHECFVNSHFKSQRYLL